MSKALTLAEVLRKYEQDHRDLTSAQVNLLTVKLRQGLALLEELQNEGPALTGSPRALRIDAFATEVKALDGAHSPLAVDADGEWGFWDETWSNWYGGFGSRFEANQALRRYAAQL